MRISNLDGLKWWFLLVGQHRSKVTSVLVAQRWIIGPQLAYIRVHPIWSHYNSIVILLRWKYLRTPNTLPRSKLCAWLRSSQLMGYLGWDEWLIGFWGWLFCSIDLFRFVIRPVLSTKGREVWLPFLDPRSFPTLITASSGIEGRVGINLASILLDEGRILRLLLSQ